MGESKVQVQSGDGLKVIHASLYRMATKSMAQAYTILGYKVNHALLGHSLETNWNGIEKAAEATFPTMAMRRFDRRDWDELWGNEYDIVTDIASPFNLELIKAYPNAKVVIVQRDFDGWWKSFEKNIKDKVFEFPKSYIIALISTLFLGVRPIQSQRKALFGMFDVRSPAGINKARGREVYDEYFRKIREIVPPENRLEYKIGDGWEPLCEFLGVPVPEGVDFPRSNDGAALNDQTNSRLRMHASRMATNSFIGKVLVVFLLLCLWMAYRVLRR